MKYKVSKEDLEKWQKQRWEEDKVSKIVEKNGFVLKTHGRSGMIYFSENGKLCEIYVEMSGVSEYDMLVYFSNLFWLLPEKKRLTKLEENNLKVELMIWLKDKNIKSDL